jgi:hypothetical protein
MSHFWCEQLGYVSHAPLGLSFNGSPWFCRQLQNGCLLAFTQACQQHDSAIRKFQRIVMHPNLVFVDLPKDRGLMHDYFIAPELRKLRRESAGSFVFTSERGGRRISHRAPARGC